MILGKPYQIETNFGTQKTQFQIGIRIENFPSFVSSRTQYFTKNVIVSGTKWHIGLLLVKHYENMCMYVSPSSNIQPEELKVGIFGERCDEKDDSSFIVNASFRFKQPSTAKGFRILERKFALDETDNSVQALLHEIAIVVINFLLLLHPEIFHFSDRIF